MDYTNILMVSAGLLLTYFWFRRPDPKLPPFPVRPLPLIGNLLNMDTNPRPLFKKWANQCGNIFSLNLAGTHMVVLNGYDLIREAFVKKADSFSDRPPFFVDEVTGLAGKGVVLSSGATWKEQRAVSLCILKTFGMGKNILAEKIREEVDCFMDYLATLKRQPTNMRVMTNISVSNIISSIIIGHRFNYDDKEYQEIISILVGLGSDTKSCSVLNFITWLKYLPGDLFKAKRMSLQVNTIFRFIRKFVVEKQECCSDTNEVINFIDAYIAERTRKIAKGIPTIMDDDHLVKLIFDLFAVGTETTSTTLYWCILYLLNFPKVQAKLQAEIEDVVGGGRAPNMQDLPKMIYLKAFIMESQRLASITPLSVTHLCSEETDLGGFTVPKGALITSNLDSLMHSEQIWGADVMDFKPERFIDDNGQNKVPDEYIPFGIGRRACLGEAMARMELFLYLSSLIQRFEFLPVEPGCLPSTEPVFGIITSPHQYELKLIERQFA